MSGVAPGFASWHWQNAAACCFLPAMASSRRAIWRNGYWPIACPCAFSCNCTSSCGARHVAAERAVVLLSGGLDSATALAWARAQGHDCFALSVSYGQRHHAELDAAATVARALGAREHRVMQVDLGSLGGSALTDPAIAVPEQSNEGIPVTYVPARNTVLLSLGLAWAEVLEAAHLVIGVNAV